ncbi:HemK2/MTQ2 family protein methyltransferase [Rhodococcus sp. Z13]|uniref:HemK2/MTQ2 family protein methyltransferase n=1 Tax=Rhodococcus sacchari TaxID=2962047 RepID=UPI0039A758EB
MTASLALDGSDSPRVWRLPGVYRPQEDSYLLANALADAGGTEDSHVLDFCTGTGFLAVNAAMMGAASVTAFDIAPRAVLTARMNAWTRRLPIRAHRGGLDAVLRHGPFDVVLSNPPYVPCDGEDRDPRWDAGADGRGVLDPLCDSLPALLTPGGFALIVHSEFTGVETTLRRLRDADLKASVVARRRIPFGPVLRSRADYLYASHLAEPGSTTEEVVVVRADRPHPGR